MYRKAFAIIIFVFCAVIGFGQLQNTPPDTASFIVKRLSINSNRGDFSPFLQNGKLYFSSGRVHRYGLVYLNEDTTQELEDIFYAEKIDSVSFRQPHYFSEKVNTRFNDGPLCFNRAGDVLYITGNDLARKSNGIEPLDIFVSRKIHGHWETPGPLPFCTGSYSYCHPALMSDQKTLVFSSDIPGGQGGMDLYITRAEGESWSIPRNLGSKINGPGNELFSFITTKDILYFSSNRAGTLDVYSIDLTNPAAEVRREEWPINSDKDDFGVWIDSSGTCGYFSSNRDGNDDIYYFKSRYPSFNNCIQQEMPRYCYTFFEESTMQSEDTLGMIYEWDLGDGTKQRGVTVKHCYAQPGNYAVQLNIVDKASGALFYNELSYDFAVEPAKVIYMESPDTIITGKETSFSSEKAAFAGHRIGDRYWFFGDGDRATGQIAKHTFRKSGDYEIKLGVFARNDSTGKVDAICVAKKVLVRDSSWISQHQSSRTHVVWPPPHKPKAKYHTEKGEDVNFRVHLGSSNENIPTDSKVFSDLGEVSKTKEKDTYHYTSGKVKKLSEAVPFYRKAKKRGFKDAAVVTFYKDSIMPNQEHSMRGVVRETSIRPVLDQDSVLWSMNVFFDFNSAQLQKNYFGALDSLCRKLKQNRRLELIILAITDSVGTDAYNYKLSAKRAASVKNYIVGKGIADKRLDIVSLGEKVPVTYNSSKNMLLSNRRVELLVVKSEK